MTTRQALSAAFPGSEAAGRTLPRAGAFDAYRGVVLAHWTITLNPAPGMPDVQPREVSEEFVHRIATAIDDLDTLDVFVG